jgi:sporulation protein YlmC with PRC-barrel domain
MAQNEQFTIGAKANCTDGPCGEVSRLIIDPATETVTHLVIKSGMGWKSERLVPVEQVDSTADVIQLRCTRDEFDQFEQAEERAKQDDGNGAGIWEMESGHTKYGDPIGDPYVPSVRVRTVIQNVIPQGKEEMGPGDPVHATDGEIGRVLGFRVDPDDHKVTHVLLQEGHLWGHREVAIPISAVTKVDIGIRLNLTKQQVENLPPVEINQPG